MNTDNTTIVLSENPIRVKQMQAKAAEYQRRAKDPDNSDPFRLDSLIKWFVISSLLEHGHIECHVMRNKLYSNLHEHFDEWTFANAWAVIKAYNETGGQEVFFGTGLPPVNQVHLQ